MYSARIGGNTRETLAFPPDSKPHPYIDFMSSQCTVIVYIHKGHKGSICGAKLRMKSKHTLRIVSTKKP
jgi:hypothetical protein